MSVKERTFATSESWALWMAFWKCAEGDGCSLSVLVLEFGWERLHGALAEATADWLELCHADDWTPEEIADCSINFEGVAYQIGKDRFA